jgi:cysteine-S-conjugate beta-lyase
MPYNFDEVVDRTVGNAEKYAARKRLFGSDDVLPMWVADMDIVTAPFIREAVSKRASESIYGYEELPSSMWDAFIIWMQKRYAYTINRKWLFNSHSVVTSLGTALLSCSEVGDEAIVFSPVYNPFYSVVTNNHRSLLISELINNEGVYEIDYAHVEKIITPKTKAILLCSPHNPVGRVWSKTELQKLADICIKHDLTIISDEVHSDLVYAPHKHIPIATLSKEIADRTISCCGPGKTFNLGGIALSCVVISGSDLRRKFREVDRAVHFAESSVFAQVAFEVAYNEGERWVDELLVYLKSNIDEVNHFCQKNLPLLVPVETQGTYLMWIDCSALALTESELKDFFVNEAKIGPSMGISFGENGAGFMRLNIAVPNVLIKKALFRLENAYKKRNFDAR